MFDLSDKFFGDLGLDKMTQSFWDKSVIVKPADKQMVWYVIVFAYIIINMINCTFIFKTKIIDTYKYD